jgi:hypothetical protein
MPPAVVLGTIMATVAIPNNAPATMHRKVRGISTRPVKMKMQLSAAAEVIFISPQVWSQEANSPGMEMNGI